MSFRRLFFLSVFTAISFAAILNVYSFTRREPPAPPLNFAIGNTYDKEWMHIRNLENQGLYKSALQAVDSVYQKAKKEDNAPQLVKCLIHRMKYEQYMEEYSIEKAIAKLQEECKTAHYPLKPMLQSMLAETYWGYYQRNRWKFNQRTQTVDFKMDDVQTWDLKTIIDQTIKNYQLSLQNTDSLKRTKLELYDAVINKQNDSRLYRPTLFDFLAHRALTFFRSTEPDIIKPSYTFEINSEDYFREYNVFARYKIDSPDSLSLNFYAVKIFQELLAFHGQDSDPSALVDDDVERLRFIRSHSTSEFKDSLYLEALRTLEKKFYTNQASMEVSYAIALEYYDRGTKYDPTRSEDNKWKFKEVLEMSEGAVKRYPSAFDVHNFEVLINEVQRKNLGFQVDRVNEPSRNFPSLLQYRNVKRVYFRIGEVDVDRYNSWLESLSGEDFIKKIAGLKPVKKWALDVIDDGDHQQHSMEVKMPGLPLGHYVIMASPDSNFLSYSNALAYSPVWISNISYLNRQMPDGSYDFFVMHRQSGAPLAGVTGQLLYEKYNYVTRKYEYVHGQKFTSDAKGYFNVPAPTDEYRNFNVEFTMKGEGKAQDMLHTDYAMYQYKYYPYVKKRDYKTFFFTDRSIYRPGQTIYFKGILISTDGETNEIVPNHPTTVTFYDVNSQKLASLDLTTNEYGSFNGTFTAPNGVLNGQMYISNVSGTSYFSVEDYKRPKFEVTMNPVKGSYRLDDSVKADGYAKAYAGSSIDGAQVKYRVVRNASFPYWWYCWRGYYPTSPQMEIANGTTTTNDTGGFFIHFKAIPDRSISKNMSPTYTYTVYADVTDINGETHSSSSYISVAYSSLNVSVDIGDKVDRNDKNKFYINTTNMSGQFEPAKGMVNIYRLKDPGKVFRKRNWSVPDKFMMSKEEFYTAFPNDVYRDENDMFKWEKEQTVYGKNFSNVKIPSKDKNPDKEIKDSVFIANLNTWQAGVYMMETTCRDKYGEEVKDVKYFTLYSSNDNKLPASFTDWFVPVKTEGEPGESAKFLIGTKYDSVSVLYEVEEKNKVVSREYITLSGEQKLITVPIQEKHRGNFAVHFAFVKKGRMYNFSQVITVPYSNKEIDMEFESFRSKLTPGQQEEWKLKLKGKHGEKIMAEMLATLYDASLDAFKPHNWSADIYSYYYSAFYWQQQGFSDVASQLYDNGWNTWMSAVYRYYDALNWFDYYTGVYNEGYYFEHELNPDYDYDGVMDQTVVRGGTWKEPPPPPKEEMEQTKSTGYSYQWSEKKKDESDDKNAPTTVYNVNIMDANGASNANFLSLGGEASGKKGKDDLGNISARSNLAETAFFYPTLQTDENGSVVIKFTIPEALTKWKMMGFAYTKDLKYGQITKECVTQKELMVMPNPPRFFRENDKISFSAKISNLAEKDLSGSAQLFLYDAISMKDITSQLMGNASSQKTFSTKKGLSTSLNWDLSIPEGVGAIQYKVVAKADNYSDGEEQDIPVLTNRMLVTETMPLPIRGNETKTFTFEKLVSQNGGSTTLRNHKLTLEFTSNPAWYAVQSLPYLMEYPYECAEQTFSRFYANSIATHIANSSPKIKAVFDAWKMKSPDAFLSNLQKNQELKSLMLEETPWVLEAKDESERKKRVGLLFDLNKMSNELDRALYKLQKMQVSNGGWPWFEGMPDDRYITQHIITGMGHLDHLGIKNVRDDYKTWNMVKRGVEYLDDRIREDYEWILKWGHPELDNIGYEQIQYLYARSYFKDVPVSSRNQRAFDYFKGQAQKFWTAKNRYMQGMIALGLYRYDDKKTPPAIMKSLKETSINSEEMGMYWKDNYEEGWYWYQAPIESQALLIEAFDEVANDKKSVDDLKVWLLKSKQTQDWKTTKATTEACYALLLRGTDWLATESNVEIIVGSQKIDPKQMPDVKVEEGTGYFKTSWSGSEIKTDMGKVTVTKKDPGVSWGAMYWQYFEQLDKITSAKTPLNLKKQLFLEKNTPSGPVITPITEQTVLKIGDKIKVRIELRVDRDMEYVHMKDMRASGFEPTNVISQYKYQDGLGYYESTRDASTNFFFSSLHKGTYVFEYPLVVAQSGDFSNGITSIQCMYAPEFSSHSEGIRVRVGK